MKKAKNRSKFARFVNIRLARLLIAGKMRAKLQHLLWNHLVGENAPIWTEKLETRAVRLNEIRDR